MFTSSSSSSSSSSSAITPSYASIISTLSKFIVKKSYKISRRITKLKRCNVSKIPSYLRTNIDWQMELDRLEDNYELPDDPSAQFIALRPKLFLLIYIWLECNFNIFVSCATRCKFEKRLKFLLPPDLFEYCVGPFVKMYTCMRKCANQTYVVHVNKLQFIWNSTILAALTDVNLVPEERNYIYRNIFSMYDKNQIESLVKLCLRDNGLNDVNFFNYWCEQKNEVDHWFNVVSPIINTGMACVGKSTFDNILVRRAREEIDKSIRLEKHSNLMGGLPDRDSDDSSIQYAFAQNAVHPLSVCDRHMALDRLLWYRIMALFDCVTREEMKNMVMANLEKTSETLIVALNNLCFTVFTNSNFVHARTMQKNRKEGTDEKRANLEFYHPAQQVWYVIFAFLARKPIVNMANERYQRDLEILQELQIQKLKKTKELLQDSLNNYERVIHHKIKQDSPDMKDVSTHEVAKSLGFFK